MPAALHVSIPRSFMQYYTPFILENRPTIHSLEDRHPSWGSSSMVYSISFCFALKRVMCPGDRLKSSCKRLDSLEGGRQLKLDHQVDRI